MKIREYYETQEFAEIANISLKTLSRLKKQLLQDNPKTKKVKYKSKPFKYHYTLLKKYLSPSAYNLFLENKSLRNTIKCLKQPDTLAHKLFQMDWTWWCTIAYKEELSADSCSRHMDTFYNQIENVYGENTDLRIYYTTESFSSQEGHHNHFVMNVSDISQHYSIKQDLESYFKGNRIDIQKYDEELPCIFYSEKQGLKGINWNIYGNNLTQEGIKYEVKSK